MDRMAAAAKPIRRVTSSALPPVGTVDAAQIRELCDRFHWSLPDNNSTRVGCVSCGAKTAQLGLQPLYVEGFRFKL